MLYIVRSFGETVKHFLDYCSLGGGPDGGHDQYRIVILNSIGDLHIFWEESYGIVYI